MHCWYLVGVSFYLYIPIGCVGKCFSAVVSLDTSITSLTPNSVPQSKRISVHQQPLLVSLLLPPSVSLSASGLLCGFAVHFVQDRQHLGVPVWLPSTTMGRVICHGGMYQLLNITF